MVFVDSNIILDLWDHDPVWESWSKSQILRLLPIEDLVINPVVYAEVSPRFNSSVRVDRAIEILKLSLIDTPREAAFLAGKAFLKYRQQGGTKTKVLSDFFIGAHAAFLGAPLLTRDARRFATYFPTVRLITP
jgi:hypothetical protein